jgi:hypothetical protein
MMKKITHLLIVFLLSTSITAFSDPGITSAGFLKLGQGNRATSMGGSFAALVRGPVSIYWNPAGLATGIFNEARFIYNSWVQGIYWGYAAYRHNLGDGGFGVGLTYLNSGELIRREDGREESGSSYTLSDIAIDAGQGLRLTDNINAGVSIKFINETIDDEMVTALAVGVGGQYHRKLKGHYVSAGISGMNLGTRMGYSGKFPLPAVIRLDVADEFPGERLKAHAGFDYYVVEGTAAGGVGAEYGVAPFMDLRCGYRLGYKDVSSVYGFTAGIGIKYVENVEYRFDYSFATLGELGYINRVGFGVRF